MKEDQIYIVAFFDSIVEDDFIIGYTRSVARADKVLSEQRDNPDGYYYRQTIEGYLRHWGIDAQQCGLDDITANYGEL